MVLIGITGGIGMGKSMAGRLLTQAGVPVVDTDDLARDLTAKGSDILRKIVLHFGTGILTSEGQLDRSRLAALVFSEPKLRVRLEGILHPEIALQWRRVVEQWRSKRVKAGAVLIPLLFEKGYEREFSVVVSMLCCERTQWSRLTQRGWSIEQIRARTGSQMDPLMKATQANHVVWTEGSIEAHSRQWAILLGLLGAAAG